jgi:ATP-dependent Lon protease
MEVIELSGYTLEEKVQISERHLIPKILKDTGLLPYVHSHPLRSDILVHIIQYYCRESGVRSLQRTL